MFKSNKLTEQRTLDELFQHAKPIWKLPTVPSDFHDMNVISSQTLANLIQTESSMLIIDARFSYEYEGGHIKNAVNPRQNQEILAFLGTSDWSNTPIIIHCEFSEKRGPSVYRWVRNMDRCQNMENYPLLDYPQLYLLQGGYKVFFTNYPELCQPSNYVQMKKKHKSLLRKVKL